MPNLVKIAGESCRASFSFDLVCHKAQMVKFVKGFSHALKQLLDISNMLYKLILIVLIQVFLGNCFLCRTL